MKGKKALLPLIFYAISLFGNGCSTHMAKQESLEEALGMVAKKEECLNKNFRERAKGVDVNSIVMHGTGKPNYVSNWKKRPYDNLKACLKEVETTGFSYHFIIGRNGTTRETVPIDKEAFHAGSSKTPDGRFNANSFSVGISLIGPYWRDVSNKKNGKSGYESVQYSEAAKLCVEMHEKGIRHIYFHEEISGNNLVKWGAREKSKAGDPGINNGAFDMAEFMKFYKYWWNKKYYDNGVDNIGD